MQNYDINIDYGEAILEVTIQNWQYKGHYRIKIQGNIKGASVLEVAFDTDYLENKDIIWNDCKLNIQENFEGETIYTAELEDEKENILVIDGYIEELKDNIVEVKIIDYEELKEGQYV